MKIITYEEVLKLKPAKVFIDSYGYFNREDTYIPFPEKQTIECTIDNCEDLVSDSKYVLDEVEYCLLYELWEDGTIHLNDPVIYLKWDYR